MNKQRIGMKNLIGLLAIGGGLVYWGASVYLDSRQQWWNLDKEDPCLEIRKANDCIGLLAVSEIVTKDVIYLKQDISKWKRYLTNVGKCALKTSMYTCVLGWVAMAADPDFLSYEMDPGTGVVWGHQGVIEYVIDLSRAEVKLEDDASPKQRLHVRVTVPEPYVDPNSVGLNLETFMPILKNKQFQDGDETMKNMERSVTDPPQGIS